MSQTNWIYHVLQNKTDMPAYKQSLSENNWSTKREEWRHRDLQNIIQNSFKEKEKREYVEADFAVCPHTTMPEYAFFSKEWFEVVVALQTLILYSLYIDIMLLADKDAFGPFSLHIFQI